MPRKARIDAPGALHHIICRGIERCRIFEDDSDRNNFLFRLGNILKETATPCYAFALIPNHFHLLLRTGKEPISIVMRRLLTGYAVSFNRRHRRSGHLFQNRFKSILCQDDLYLKELTAYIHLNPLRARLVQDLKSLATYRYGGHSALMGKHKMAFQNVAYILKLFGNKTGNARVNYREYVQKRFGLGRRPELIGGGLLRSSGGWRALKAMSKARIHLKGDERILGDSDFVETVLAEQNERLERRYGLKAQGYDIHRIVEKVGRIFDIAPEMIWDTGKQPLRVKARSLTCYWAVKELGMSGTDVGKWLHLCQSAVSRAVVRGEKVARDMNISLK